jgi:NTE family protein
MPGTVFVLGGGANLGATQVGMLRALFEHDITPDAVVGCSVGAVNGAMIAFNPTLTAVAHLESLWRNLDGDAICPAGKLNALRLLARRYPTLEGHDGLRGLLDRHLPFRTFDQTTIPLHVVATSLETGRERWLDTGNVIPALLASAAIPAVFPPVVIDGEPLVDGAVVNNVPISRAIELDADRIVVLHVGNFSRPRRPPRRPVEALVQSFSIARNHRFELETRYAPPGVELVVLPALDPGPALGYHDFSHAHLLIEKAYRLTTDFLASSSHSMTGASAHSRSRS